jgi:methionyl-tRNA formyltransferase
MRILWIGGDHARHLFYFNSIQRKYEFVGALLERREAMVPEPPPNIGEHDLTNFVTHFRKREQAEERYFQAAELPKCPTLKTTAEDLNSPESAEFVSAAAPDVVLIFGSGLIKDPLLEVLPERTINLHLGLSPRYRGAATLFWPFYFMEPSHAGCTFHYITGEPDFGDVIHQVTPKLEAQDGIHDVACKAVMAAAEAAIGLLDIMMDKGDWRRFRQKGTGKNFLAADFRPEHLRVIYDVFQDDIVRHYLEGRLLAKEPELQRQF